MWTFISEKQSYLIFCLDFMGYKIRRQNMQMYFGDVSLCYSYSLAMALETYGYDFKAEFLEAIMVMGNGASIVKEDEEHPLVFF